MLDETCCSTDQLTTRQREKLRAMLDAAFDGDFSDADWQHTLGGLHVFLSEHDTIVSHVSVVARQLVVEKCPLTTGFVEAVATPAGHRRKGYATRLMRLAGRHIHRHYELGALCTGQHAFYARLGWQPWRGKTYVRVNGQWIATPDEDDAVMVLPTTACPDLDRTQRISCEWREGDVW